MAKYGDLIKKAREEDNQQPIKPESQQPIKEESQETIKPETQKPNKPDEKMVNLCVKVPESLRRHWAAEAKRKGTTMTDVMVEALTQKFGLPNT